MRFATQSSLRINRVGAGHLAALPLRRFLKCHLFVSVLSLTELGKSGLMAAHKRER
jgi:hypothetical protein